MGTSHFPHHMMMEVQNLEENHELQSVMPTSTDPASLHIDIGNDYLSTSPHGPLPIFLKFEDVEYKVRGTSRNPVKGAIHSVASQLKMDQGNSKHILKGITGNVGPGEILALMGPSGSGKTTLLKSLGGRLSGDIKGKISYNDTPYSTLLKRRIGFVTQEDVLFPHLTVEETLVFAAFLRLPTDMSKEQKRSKADETIKQLGLERCRHMRIGGMFVKGISGGEKKRTSIGYEILVDPSLLLLDEPTSSLDSTSATKLLLILRSLAKTGRTIVTTIHQPSSRIFYMFDKLLLLTDGHPIYYGKARETMHYFSSLGFLPEIAMNPAEFLLDIATGHVNNISLPETLHGSSDTQELDTQVIKFLQDKYQVELEPMEKGELYKEAPVHLQYAIMIKKDWTMKWFEQFIILAKRTFRERQKDYADKLRLAQTVGVAILLGSLWWKSKIATEAQLRDQVGLIFYICIFWTSSSLFGASYVFPFEKVYLVKERKADMYRLSVYYVSSTLCDMVANIIHPLIFLVILYFMADLRRSVPSFLLTWLAVLLIVFASQGMGELIGAAILSIKQAGLMASFVLMLFLLTGGYYVQHMPEFMRWLKHVSFMRYGFGLLLKVQYSGNLVYDCQSEGGCRSLQDSPSLGTFNVNGTIEEAWILLAMAVGYRLIAYFFLRRRVNLTTL